MDRILRLAESGVASEQSPRQVSHVHIDIDLFDKLRLDEILERELNA